MITALLLLVALAMIVAGGVIFIKFCMLFVNFPDPNTEELKYGILKYVNLMIVSFLISIMGVGLAVHLIY